MQIVIDIPEEDYIRLRDEGMFGNVTTFKRAVRESTPLPKGHGRIGDLDALETEMVNGIRAGNYEEGYEVYAHINDMDDCVDCVRYTDTIIEADRSERSTE
jgi:hypothetical protein